ncbi:MAG: transposase family protein [Candidatus Peribacteria bacterium]|nr:MAG: transposase family protein [Candidatus Peribacteria bacterium]USN59286.1 MAG: transposase family protein [Candidatus Peribacteria bacterium]
MGVENKKKSLEIQHSHQVWSSDFTHLYYKEKEFYLATVLDEYSKEIVGYTLGFHHGKELILRALANAMKRSKTIPQFLHSDQ